MPDRSRFTYTFDNIAKVIERFTEVIGLSRFAIYVFDYGAPTGFRLAVSHPERITAIISQNGNAYEGGLSEGWNPVQKYWKDPSPANRDALRAFLKPETTLWQYTHGVADVTAVSPDGYSLDNFYLNRPGADEIQLDLLGDYKSNEHRGAFVLHEEHDEFRRFGVARVSPDDVNILWAFIEGLTRCQSHFLPAPDLHYDRAFQHINKPMCVVVMYWVRAARRILNQEHQTFLPRKIR
jgi:pimeloyl-ACP methyl ester carboxylesterase